MEQQIKKKVESGDSTKETAQHKETVGNVQFVSSNSEECADLASLVIEGRPDDGTATPPNQSAFRDGNPEKSTTPSNNIDESKNKASPLREQKTLSQMGFKTKSDAFAETDEPCKKNLYELLRRMIEKHVKPDVQICIGAHTFQCHMMVLECYSQFFMESNEKKLIILPAEKVTPKAFNQVYEWMLADKPLLQREGLLEVFSASIFLCIPSLVDQCWQCFDDNTRFYEDTAAILYMEARLFDLETLQILMLSRVWKFFLTLVASDEFLALNINELRRLLSLNTIGVNSECEIFLAAVHWLAHDWEGRKQHVLKAVESVRFSLMPPCFLVSLDRNPDCEAVARITRDPEVSRMILDGISYTTTQFCFGGTSEEFCQFLECYSLDSPLPRQWIFDPLCPYHKRLPCIQLQFLTYKAFLEYLRVLQEMGKDHWRELEAM